MSTLKRDGDRNEVGVDHSATAARRKAVEDFNASAEERMKPAGREATGYSDTAVTAAAMKAVKWKLTDPSSAQFRSVRVYQQASGTKAVCGEVNAKNRAGGFNGYERFVSAGTVEHTWLEQQVSGFESVWAQVCRQRCGEGVLRADPNALKSNGPI